MVIYQKYEFIPSENRECLDGKSLVSVLQELKTDLYSLTKNISYFSSVVIPAIQKKASSVVFTNYNGSLKIDISQAVQATDKYKGSEPLEEILKKFK